VRRVRAGETELFEILMRRYNQRVYRVVRAVLHDELEAEDVMQQAYVSAFSHLDQFHGDARFSTWLTRIALNEAFARIRKSKRFVDIDATETTTMETVMQPGPEQQAHSKELGRLLEEAVAGLPDIYRSVFMLREVEELSTRETAECLDVSEEVIKVRLHRARVLLRDSLYARVGTTAPETFVFLRPRCDRVVAAVLSRIVDAK
jgi:RNA polymerase sigma-70 factor (ECF subfamily)